MIKKLLDDLDEPNPKVLFAVGQLVKHRRYGYRGVVAGYDLKCKAEDDWYHSNKTQPSREQPWYHVLVHNSAHTTYAAQSNLMADDNSEPINHPLISKVFLDFKNGKYIQSEKDI